MTIIKNKVTQDPVKVRKVHDRIEHINYALDKVGVTCDAVSPSAHLDIAVTLWRYMGYNNENIVKLLRDVANMIELEAAPKGRKM